MDNFFYNILAIIAGIEMIICMIINIKIDKKIYTITSIIIGVILLLTGTFGFIVPKNLSFITIIILLVLAVIFVILTLTLDKKTRIKKKK